MSVPASPVSLVCVFARAVVGKAPSSCSCIARSGLPITFLGINLQAHAPDLLHRLRVLWLSQSAIGLVAADSTFLCRAVALECVGHGQSLARALAFISAACLCFLRPRTIPGGILPLCRGPVRTYSEMRSATPFFTLYISMGAFFLWALWSDLKNIRQPRQPTAFDLPPTPEPGCRSKHSAERNRHRELTFCTNTHLAYLANHRTPARATVSPPASSPIDSRAFTAASHGSNSLPLTRTEPRTSFCSTDTPSKCARTVSAIENR